MKRMNKILLAICIALFSLVITNNTFCQCNCDPYDPNPQQSPCNSWTEAIDPLVVNYLGCSCLVYYSYCSEINYRTVNIRIDRIVPVNQNCTPLLIEGVIRQAAVEALASAHWIGAIGSNGTPGPGQQQYKVVLKIPSCMKYDDLTSTYIPCNTSRCCIIHYFIKLINGCPTVMSRTIYDCPCLNPIGGCNNACDNIVFPADTCLKNTSYESGCGWNCIYQYFDDFWSSYNSQAINVLDFYCWNNDTLCVTIEKVFYHTSSGTFQGALRRATEITLYNMGMEIPDGQIKHIRIVMPSCYTSYQDQTTTTLVPCYDECCTTLYTVHHNGDIIQVEQDYTHSPSPIDPTCAISGDCSIPACTVSIYGNNIQANPKLPFIIDKDKVYQNDTYSYVKPIPSKDLTEIHLISNINGIYTTIITDINGREIAKFEFSKSTTESVYNLNTSEYLNGIYMYQIFDGDKMIFKGKFVISH